MGNNMEDVHQRASWLHSENSSAAGDIFGEPQKTARIGDQYQANIPSLMTEDERLQLIESPASQHAKIDAQNQFNFGLSIPVVWAHDQHKIKESAKGKSGTDNCFLPVPGSSGEAWRVIEHDSFLLGLYIFGKNLRLVNKFVLNKGMPNVISYYYGKFYRTSEHQTWSKYRKKKSKKAIPGKKIFNGWRRQELLSRLLPNITDECKMILTQVTRTFEEGKLLFEKYVLTLRDMVGIDLLVEAVGIGKEKLDLTSSVKKPRNSKKLHSACSSLETEEIVDLLKNGIGLSKARLYDLFWEAVWPRLLAKGWHSEQPRNYACQNSKHSFVFLPPGITKFSRRSLEKGSQYFDSFTEVLNKVASEPRLLEHEPGQDRLVESHAKQGSDDVQDLMKYTIVDTSLVGVVKVRELRSLPIFESADTQASSSVSGETEKNATEESQREIQGVVDSSDCETGTVNKEAVQVNPRGDSVVSRSEDKKPDVATNEKPVRKLKLILKPQSKRHRVTDTRNNNSSGEDEPLEDDPRPEKKRQSIVIDLNNPRVTPHSNGDGLLLSSKPSVLPATNGQRHSTRNRPLSTKALEALSTGFLNPKKKRRGSEDRTPRRVRAKTALVSSCGVRCIENRVDGVLNGSSHMVSESPK